MYTALPPGRLRRLTYSDYIRNRRMNSILRASRMNIYHPPRIITYSPITTNINFSYESLSQLKDVKIGLINKNLLKNSKPEIYLDKSNTELCVICQDDITNNQIIRKIKCKHIFHIECIDEWFLENKKCPTCKYEL